MEKVIKYFIAPDILFLQTALLNNLSSKIWKNIKHLLD